MHIFFLFTYFCVFLTEKTKTHLESENSEITADLQRITQQKQEGDRKIKNMESQLTELSATRVTQDETLTRVDANLQKAQRECDNLNQQLEEIETKAASLEVRSLSFTDSFISKTRHLPFFINIIMAISIHDIPF